MLLYAVVLGLVALTAADPEIKEKVQQEQTVYAEKQPILPEQQQVGPVNVIPFYKQVYNPFSSTVYTGYPRDRNFYGYSHSQKYENQKQEDYPYFYKYFMSYPYGSNYYPYRNNYYMKYRFHDSQDVHGYPNSYGYQDFVRQPQVYTPGYIKHPYSQRYNADIDYPYALPYSPSYYSQHAFKQGYPHVSKYYGKGFDDEYVTPWTTYGKIWDAEYIKNHFGRNLNGDSALPVRSTIDWEGEPLSHDEKTGVYYKPIISREVSIESDYVKPYAAKNPSTATLQQIVTRNVGLEDEPSSYEWHREYANPRNIYYEKHWDSGRTTGGYGKGYNYVIPILAQ